jgi:hypothetical protein
MAVMAPDHPDFDTRVGPRGSRWAFRGRVRVAPDMPEHLLQRTLGVSGDPLDTELKEVRQA